MTLLMSGEGQREFLGARHLWARQRDWSVVEGNSSVISQLLADLRPLTLGGAFPYEICRYTILAVPRYEERYYVLVTRFTEIDEYDVRMYTPVRQLPVSSDISCYQWALTHVHGYRDELLRRGERVHWSSEATVYVDFPSPPVPERVTDGSDWGPIINAALRSRVWTTPTQEAAGQ